MFPVQFPLASSTDLQVQVLLPGRAVECLVLFCMKAGQAVFSTARKQNIQPQNQFQKLMSIYGNIHPNKQVRPTDPQAVKADLAWGTRIGFHKLGKRD